MNTATDPSIIMMVAQKPFETTEMNQFCKLIPIVYSDGSGLSPEDFPNDGEVWWMLTAQSSRWAEPGRLVVGRVEPAARYDSHDPTSSRYQVIRDSVRELTLNEGFEVTELSVDAIENIQDVVSRDFRLGKKNPPVGVLMLRWRSAVYGPFTALDVVPGSPGQPHFCRIHPLDTNAMIVYQMDSTRFFETIKPFQIVVEDEVSLTSHRRRDSYNLEVVRYQIVLAAGYERILATNPRKLVLEPLERKLMRLARACLTRAKRQQLKQILDELEITGRETAEAQDLLETVGRVKTITEQQDVTLDAVADAMLKSGLLGGDRIAKAEQAFAEKYVQDRTAVLQANVEQNLTLRREELRRVETALKESQTILQKEQAQRREALERELAVIRDEALSALHHEREEFEVQKAELQRQQELLQVNLEKVTRDLREAGDEVVNRFLTIAPLIGTLGLTTPQTHAGDLRTGMPDKELASRPIAFHFPSFVTKTAVDDTALNEDAFFDRFRRVVENNGFAFRLLDLQRFHLSVKCGEMTVLGGPSGTGKSSLPMLYARALLGNEGDQKRPGCLMVNINPSWMDARDLLGHMNTLEGRFYPAESGLFQHLVYAQKEHELHGSNTGLYLTCLDEMNLSQVEHYFSDFMMVLERTDSARVIRCFSTESANETCPLRSWSTITLSPALRFIGTVNFDETTRLLSDRFLDRSNLIRLTTAGLPNAIEAGAASVDSMGRMVTLADYEAWCPGSALPSELGALVDQMRPLLDQIGCPLSPRVYRGMCRFVGSSAALLPPPKAFDLQVAQRIIPKIRSLVTKRQMDALDSLLQLLGQNTACTFEESLSLLEEARGEAKTDRWGMEE